MARDGQNITESANNQYYYTGDAGNYTVFVTNVFGCFNTSGEFNVTMEDCGTGQPAGKMAHPEDALKAEPAMFKTLAGDDVLNIHPNPLSDITEIFYSIKDTVPVRIEIYNMYGQKVAGLLENRIQNAGSYQLAWDAGALSRGVYFCTLTAGNFKKTKRMVVLR